MLALFLLSTAHYFASQRITQQQLELATSELAAVLVASLKQGMLANDRETLQATTQDLTAGRGLEQIWLLNLQGEVKVSSDSADRGLVLHQDDLGCEGCHAYPAESIPHAIRLPSASPAVRVAVPIDNETACQGCHTAGDAHLGLLLVDASLSDTTRSLQAELQRNLFGSVLFSLLIGALVYALVNRAIVRPIQRIHDVVVEYSRGDLASRVSVEPKRTDEISVLGKTFNSMADSLAEQEEHRLASARIREVAIVEERERIARELHDGIAQFLAYVSAKAEAARLFLEKGQKAKVEESLHDLEEEARKQSLDVRASILGLKVFTGLRRGLAADIDLCIEQSNRFMDLIITTEIDPAVQSLALDAETELQVLRILQEAVSNIRKHSRATAASVTLRPSNSSLELTIRDDGIGFDPAEVVGKGQPHFGLATMRERAEDIDADFKIDSALGAGTNVIVILGLPPQDS
jgi:signal transduction histidine kinase